MRPIWLLEEVCFAETFSRLAARTTCTDAFQKVIFHCIYSLISSFRLRHMFTWNSEYLRTSCFFFNILVNIFKYLGNNFEPFGNNAYQIISIIYTHIYSWNIYKKYIINKRTVTYMFISFLQDLSIMLCTLWTWMITKPLQSFHNCNVCT